MTKTHLIKDESLGGLMREYVEVEREANVGDYVINNKGNDAEAYYKITGYRDEVIPSYSVEYDEEELWDQTIAVSIECSITLEPTDIVHVEGERYKLVDRRAEVGEKIVVLASEDANSDGYKDGDIFTCMHCSPYYPYLIDVNDYITLYNHEYIVLIPVESNAEPTTVDESQASPEVIDMLANLSRRIVELEREVASCKRIAESEMSARATQTDRWLSLKDEIDTLHANQKRMAEELANGLTQKDAVDSDLVIVELARLLARESRKVGR